MAAISGRGITRSVAMPSEMPLNPPPPFGKFRIRSTIVMAPAAISVISASASPLSRSAGRPISVPITPVIAPVASRISGNGRSVAKASRSETQPPTPSSAIWQSEISPTRP